MPERIEEKQAKKRRTAKTFGSVFLLIYGRARGRFESSAALCVAPKAVYRYTSSGRSAFVVRRVCPSAEISTFREDGPRRRRIRPSITLLPRPRGHSGGRALIDDDKRVNKPRPDKTSGLRELSRREVKRGRPRKTQGRKFRDAASGISAPFWPPLLSQAAVNARRKLRFYFKDVPMNVL